MDGDDLSIRVATSDDAEAMSRVVRTALRETNARDYPETVIDAVTARYSAARMIELMRARRVLVGVRNGTVVGTASLDGATVQTVYVAPGHQGEGVGTSLMAAVETLAREGDVQVLTVPSSITAESFYRRLGFDPVGDGDPGEDGLIVLNKRLRPSSESESPVPSSETS